MLRSPGISLPTRPERGTPPPGRVATAPDGFPFDVLASKIKIPAPSVRKVSRTALVNRLRTDLGGAAVVTIVAPAGYGKTTLLAQWAERDERPFAWVTLDRRDNDPVVFLRDLVAAMAVVGPVDRRVVKALTSADDSIWTTAVPRVAAMVAAAEEWVLVLDNAHVLDAGESAEVLAVLADELPEGSTLVLSARVEPALAVGRRTGGDLAELGAEDLAFTRRETALFVRNAGVTLSEPAMTALSQKTEGWAAALQLLLLSVKKAAADGDGAASRAAREVKGDDRYLADYVRSQYLGKLTPKQLTFLQRTSVLEKMSGALCDATLDRTGSSEELEAIKDANMFLIPLMGTGRGTGITSSFEIFCATS